MAPLRLPLQDWLRRLETLSAGEINLGLERVAEVLGRMTFEAPARVILVGGTNGKGSSVEMLRALLSGDNVRPQEDQHQRHGDQRHSPRSCHPHAEILPYSAQP